MKGAIEMEFIKFKKVNMFQGASSRALLLFARIR